MTMGVDSTIVQRTSAELKAQNVAGPFPAAIPASKSNASSARYATVSIAPGRHPHFHEFSRSYGSTGDSQL